MQQMASSLPYLAHPLLPEASRTSSRYSEDRQIGCSTRALDKRKIRGHLKSIEHDFRAGSRDVEVANDEVGRKLGEPALDTRAQIEERRVLVADFTAQNDERLRVTIKRNPRAARQDHARQRVRTAVCRRGPQGEGCADVGT